jgi:hypothetical protein
VLYFQPQPSNVQVTDRPAPSTPAPTLEPRDQIAKRVNAAWKAAAARVLPGATWSDSANPTPSPAAPALRMIEGAYYTDGEISVAGVTSRFSFSVSEIHLRAKLLRCNQEKVRLACWIR